MDYEKALEQAQKTIAQSKEVFLKNGEQEEDFYGFYRIVENGEDDFSYTVTFGSLRTYRAMSAEELEERLEELWEELEDLTDEIEELEEDPSSADELEDLLEQKEDVKLEISLTEQVLDEKR